MSTYIHYFPLKENVKSCTNDDDPYKFNLSPPKKVQKKSFYTLKTSHRDNKKIHHTHTYTTQQTHHIILQYPISHTNNIQARKLEIHIYPHFRYFPKKVSKHGRLLPNVQFLENRSPQVQKNLFTLSKLQIETTTTTTDQTTHTTPHIYSTIYCYYLYTEFDNVLV